MFAGAYFGHVDVADRHSQKPRCIASVGEATGNREGRVLLFGSLSSGHEGRRPFPWLMRYDNNVNLGGYSRQEAVGR
jgi:hypothetical protein